MATAYDEVLDPSVLAGDESGVLDLQAQRPRHLTILRAIDRRLGEPRRTIVDLGPGNGSLLRLSAELGFSRFVAVDQEPWPRSFLAGLEGLDEVRANFNDEGFLRDLGDESVDVVVSTEVLEHVFNHPWGYLLEAWRPVRTGGLLVLTTPNPCTLANAVRLVLGRAVLWGDEWFAKTPKVQDGRLVSFPFVHYREYSPRVFRNLVSELPRCEVVEHGFVANAGVRDDAFAKSLALGGIHRIGLGHARLVSHTQYAVLQKRSAA